ncbi:hypothetical protein I4F81_012640 [Pyropia yezoensis]|uniref:Uncharacterized protein n=1 Tax=Pyropia yezoensis TaxID=2788 RepID=A0ACC3CJS2_PYRYE|nr:hypothetical protein I4F81_012640 [Neopyropia yezoensis]
MRSSSPPLPSAHLLPSLVSIPRPWGARWARAGPTAMPLPPPPSLCAANPPECDGVSPPTAAASGDTSSLPFGMAGRPAGRPHGGASRRSRREGGVGARRGAAATHHAAHCIPPPAGSRLAAWRRGGPRHRTRVGVGVAVAVG